MRIKYDEEANAAYIYLVDQPQPGAAVYTYPCDPVAVNGMINLDFDSDQRLLGIEVLGARSRLSPELLAQGQ